MLSFFHQQGIPVRILGGGSNVLIPDEGFDGAVLLTTRMRSVFWEGENLRVWAGASLPGLVHDAAQTSLSGLEGFVGIPGTIGGAVRMNTGGRYGEIWDWIQNVEVTDGRGQKRKLNPEDAKPIYRDGGLAGMFCLSVQIGLRKGRAKEILERTRKILAEKAKAQPLTERSAGCIFKNPPGKSAGQLVEAAGCRGWREAGAAVSEKHGNFFVNRGGAKFSDVRVLMENVRKKVRERTGILLEYEIDIWS